jgi:tRNA (guanine37-N1)-methyltransferase
MKFKVFTLFAELFPGPLATSITGSALKNDLWQIEAINIRNYAFDFRKTVDDTPYGGGAGMVLKPDIISNALQANLDFNSAKKPKIIYLSPRGKLFNQKTAKKLSFEPELTLICGRFEGIDQRVIDKYEMEEISIGDYVLSGGELAAYVLIDAIIRNLPGIVGSKESLKEESFGSQHPTQLSPYDFLLEYPHYTKPFEFEGQKIPEILTSGHHQNINKWRLKQAIEITKKRRPALYKRYINAVIKKK